MSDAFGEIVDLSHAYSDDAISWPTGAGFHLEKVADGMTNEGYYYSSNNFSTSEHGGTHLDAPVHFAEGHWTVEQIPLDRLIGPVAVVDVSAQAATQPDYQIAVDDLSTFERTHGPIEPGSIVLFRTDFSKRWPDAATYLGTTERGEDAIAKLHFPGLHPDAATWLAETRAVKAVGIDTASIDHGQSRQFESHRLLNARNVPVFENLTNLDRLPARGATLVALPMKIEGGSGAPLRAVAILPK
ncbi:MAG: cyclase family protein [Vicinamibacterales bacterium]